MLEQPFNIQFVSNITGINPHTIRAWEKRYKAVIPQRDSNGRRLYLQKDIDRLKLLSDLVKNGNAISDIAHLETTNLSEIHQKFLCQTKVRKTEVKIDITATLNNIYMGLEFFKLDIFCHELNKATSNLDSKNLVTKVLTPLFYKIKEMKKSLRLNSSQEKEIFGILKAHLFRKISQTNYSPSTEKKVILASPKSDELNAISALMAALLFQDKGIDFYYLGDSTDPQSLSTICAQIKPDILFISLDMIKDSLSSQEIQNEFISTRLMAPKVWIKASEQNGVRKEFTWIDSFDTLEKKIKQL